MRSYTRLYEYLRSCAQETVALRFFEIETILGFTLPRIACTYRAWWANGGHPQANAWLHAGYKVDKVDIPGKVVSFCRTNALPAPEAQAGKKQSVVSHGGILTNLYILLYEYLRTCGKETVKLRFSQLEAILGFTLPRSAYTYRAWWANGRCSQANAWLHAGYKVDKVDIPGKAVTFCRTDALPAPKAQSGKNQPVPKVKNETMSVDPKSETIVVCGYEFRFIQELRPECDAEGKILKHYPQKNYKNEKNLPLHNHGAGAFCKFSVDAADWPGVYLWVIDGQIVYIGETVRLQQRFNMGYGNISPRNCYKGGQITNCKMNKVVAGNYERGKAVSLYFYTTADHKQVEKELLRSIYTPYNAKEN